MHMQQGRIGTGVAIVALACWGCAGRFEVVQLPERSADLYPLALTQGDVTVAVDEIRDPERAFRYFGVDLLRYDILPVNIVVTNHGADPIRIKPADVLLHRSNEIIDPLPVDEVARLAKRSGRFNRETREQVDAYYRDVAFRTAMVAPNDTRQGVLFFHLEKASGSDDSLFRKVSLWVQGDLELDVVVESTGVRERLHFGPFSLVGSGRDGWF